jgi:hypothetical protein
MLPGRAPALAPPATGSLKRRGYGTTKPRQPFDAADHAGTA